MLYIISSELEPDDIVFFNDFYDNIAINSDAISNDALRKMKDNLKNGMRPYILFATRHFEKIYRMATVYKISPLKEQLFDNQYEILSENPNTLIYTLSNKVTYLFKEPEYWSGDETNNTHNWNDNFMTFSDTLLPNTLFPIDLSSQFAKYILNYVISCNCLDWKLIEKYCSLLKFQPNITNEVREASNIYLVKCDTVESLSTSNIYGINTDQNLTNGSYLVLIHSIDDLSYIYGILRAASITRVKRLNINRFAGHITQLTSKWNVEIICDFASPARHIYSPDKWNYKKQDSKLDLRSILQAKSDKTIEQINNDCTADYINEYISALVNGQVPHIESAASLDTLPIFSEYSTNYFQTQLPYVESLKNIYILNTSCTRNHYLKLTINNEEYLYIDMSPSLFFKVNANKWDKNIVKQFLEDIKNNNAYLFIMNKDYQKFLLSLQVTGLIKHKSKRDLIYSITYSSWILDESYDSDLYCMNGVVPIMIKAKHMWKDVDSTRIKPYNQICQVLNNLPKKQLIMFSENDVGEKLDMFEYLRTYLTYETKARAANQFVNFSPEDVYKYCDAIAEKDLHLKMRLYWNH